MHATLGGSLNARKDRPEGPRGDSQRDLGETASARHSWGKFECKREARDGQEPESKEEGFCFSFSFRGDSTIQYVTRCSSWKCLHPVTCLPTPHPPSGDQQCVRSG